MSGDLKNRVSGAQTQQTSIEIEKQMTVSKLNMLVLKGVVGNLQHRARNSMSVQIL